MNEAPMVVVHASVDLGVIDQLRAAGVDVVIQDRLHVAPFELPREAFRLAKVPDLTIRPYYQRGRW